MSCGPRVQRRGARELVALALVLAACCTDLGDSPPIGPIVPDTRVPAAVTIVAPASPAEVNTGGTLKFTATVLDTAGAPITSAQVGWESDDTNIATIDASGVARGIAAGEASITATINTLESTPVVLRVVETVPDFATEVQPIFNANCTTSQCHGFQAGLTLTAAVSYSELVNVPSTQTSMLRVKPGDPPQSLLYLKLIGCTPPACVGSRMPQGAPPLAAAQIETIRGWIAGGAPAD